MSESEQNPFEWFSNILENNIIFVVSRVSVIVLYSNLFKYFSMFFIPCSVKFKYIVFLLAALSQKLIKTLEIEHIFCWIYNGKNSIL